jgi:hypothetical protein
VFCDKFHELVICVNQIGHHHKPVIVTVKVFTAAERIGDIICRAGTDYVITPKKEYSGKVVAGFAGLRNKSLRS